MIANNFEYAQPATLDEAFSLLGNSDAKALAGGMSLIPMMKLRLASPDTLVDLKALPELTGIQQETGWLKIGAMTSHHQVESSTVVRTACPLLAATAAAIGDVQVRNMGTIGGSIAHADPAADYPAALQALEARIKLASSAGQRVLDVSEFFLDTFTTALQPGELIVEVGVPIEQEGTGTSYQKCFQPASGFAIVGVAARIAITGGKITMARIGVTGLSGFSFRATAVEDLLQGGADAKTAAAVVADGIDANGDIHASDDYRRHLARVYTARAITAAIAAAK